MRLLAAMVGVLGFAWLLLYVCQHQLQSFMVFAMGAGYWWYTYDEYQQGIEPPLAHYAVAAMGLFWGTAIVLAIFRAVPVGTPQGDVSVIGYQNVHEGRDGSGGE